MDKGNLGLSSNQEKVHKGSRVPFLPIRWENDDEGDGDDCNGD